MQVFPSLLLLGLQAASIPGSQRKRRGGRGKKERFGALGRTPAVAHYLNISHLLATKEQE